MFRILGRTSSINVRKVLWAADELGLAYTHETWDTPEQWNKSEAYRAAYNPNGLVPTWVEDGFVLWDSSAILVYLAEVHGALLPPAPREQAIVLQWLAWQAADIGHHANYLVNALVRKSPGYDDAARIAESSRRLAAAMAVLEGRLKGAPFVGGAEFSIADVAVGLMVNRWLALPVERVASPAIDAYFATLKARRAAGPWLEIP